VKYIIIINDGEVILKTEYTWEIETALDSYLSKKNTLKEISPSKKRKQNQGGRGMNKCLENLGGKVK